jgi:hypothetical protein
MVNQPKKDAVANTVDMVYTIDEFFRMFNRLYLFAKKKHREKEKIE